MLLRRAKMYVSTQIKDEFVRLLIPSDVRIIGVNEMDFLRAYTLEGDVFVESEESDTYPEVAMIVGSVRGVAYFDHWEGPAVEKRAADEADTPLIVASK